MKDRLKTIAWGFGGALVAIILWVLASTAYTDHVLLRQIVALINQQQAQQQKAAPAEPGPAK